MLKSVTMGLGLEEFLIREYSFALSLTANYDLCVVTMITHTSGRTDLGDEITPVPPPLNQRLV